MRTTQRRGVTLIELVVVLAILGIMAAVTGLTIHTAAPVRYHDATVGQITQLRDSAVTLGRAVSAVLIIDDTATAVTAYPDGELFSNVQNIDRPTGRTQSAR